MTTEQSSNPTKYRPSTAEFGFIGLRSGYLNNILEQSRAALQHPQFINEVDEMLNDSIINTGISFQRSMLIRAMPKVVPPRGATKRQKDRAKFIEQCLHDMEHSWYKFMCELSYYIPYGFSVHNIVLRKRTYANGSKYDDGKWGIRKLPVRSQRTIKEWVFSDDKRYLLGCKQAQTLASDSYSGEVFLPIEQLLLFTADSRLENPLGRSPLASIWLTYKYRKEVERQESVGLQRDLQGIPVVRMPSSDMSGEASDQAKGRYTYMRGVVSNLHNNRQAGVVLPSDVGEGKERLYDIELMTSKGTKNYDTNEVVRRLNNQILTALGADVLTLGQDKVGSFSLSGSKTNLSVLMLDSRLKEIADVLNNKLIPIIYQANGWYGEEQARIEFEEFDEIDPAEFAKAVQQIAAVGFLERTRANINVINRVLGFEQKPEDEELDLELFTDFVSRSGDGMAKGSGNGTSDNVATKDNSAANVYNK